MVSKSKTAKKVLSVLLVMLMLITTIPIGILNAFAATTFTIKVTDENTGIGIENAAVSIITKVDNSEEEIVKETDLKTDSNGTISFSEINDYLTVNTDKVVTLEYKITADDYVGLEDVYEITSSNVENELLIKLESNPQITVNGGESGTHIEVAGIDVGTSKKVPAGTLVDVIVAEKENCFITLDQTAKYVDGNKYSFEVTEDLEINVKYEPITYTIELDVENGEVQPSDNGKITVIKTFESTELTFNPDVHYHLDKFLFDDEDRTSSVVNNKYTLDNSEINDDSHKIAVQFAIDTFKVTSSFNSKYGSVEIIGTDDLNQVAYGTKLTAIMTPADGYALINVNNGTDVSEDEIIPVENTNQYTYEFIVEKEVNIYADFSEVIILDSIDVNDVITVSNSYQSDDGNYYVKYEENKLKPGTSSNTAKIELNSQITYVNEQGQDVTLKTGGIVCYRNNNNDNNKFKNTNYLDKTITVNCSDVFTKIQFKTGNKFYQINGNINVLFDSVSPTISDVADITEFTNEVKTINFSVKDETENYGSINYASGINDKSITVTRSYGSIKNEVVDVDITNRSFKYVPVESYTGVVTYTINVADNVGNSASKSISVSNDTVEPTLIDNKDAVKFVIENDNVFAHILNKISRGKWLNEQMTVELNATDGDGYGFDDLNSIAQIALVNEDGTVFTSGYGHINEKGYAEISLSNVSPDTTFKGSIYYNICDRLSNGYKELNENTVVSDWILLTTENTTSFEEGNVVMIEENKPVVSDITAVSLNDVIIPFVNNSYICNGDAEFTFTITDDFSGLYSYVAKVNGSKELSKSELENENNQNEQYELLSTGELNIDTVGVEPKEDCSYELTVDATDYSGNVAETKTCVIYKDTVAPEITVDDFEFEGKNHSSVYGDVVVADYGFYFKEATKVKISATDNAGDNELASGVASIKVYLQDIDGTVYVVTENGAVIQKSENNSPDDAVDILTDNSIEFTIPQNFKGQIYAKATDKVKNTPETFVNPDGSVIESAEKHSETSSIEFISVPQSQGTQNNKSNYSYTGEAQTDKSMDFDVSKNVPLYNRDIAFGVKVADSYSGIDEIKYTIIEGNEETVKTVKVDNNGSISGENEGWEITNKDENLVTEMVNTIAVSGNYNDMVLLVELIDRSGNKSYDYYVFGIDKTAPSVTVTYNNNDVDTQSGTGNYFDADRKATILVQERNFNTENVKFTLKNAEGAVPKIVDKCLVVKDAEGNGDGNVYQYEISYTSDGVYTFNVAYTDRAANAATVDYKDSVGPNSFVIDKTLPTISVSYDNNEAQNGKYFKAHRTATITVVEHNFDVNRVSITQTASLAGETKSVPAVSWVNSGDIHIATINYNEDADYTFDITMTDKAGNKESNVNYGSSVAAKEFTVDTTYSNIVKVEGITDKGVLGLENGEINLDASISITINDINLDAYKVTLTRSRVIVDGESNKKTDIAKDVIIDNPDTQCSEDNVDVTGQFVANASGNSNNTAVINIPKTDDNGVKNDGLYTLTVEANDKAGNAYNTNANIITFSVNRFGSVFTFGKDLYNLINENDGYTQEVTSNDLTVYEYNATDIQEHKVEVIANNDSLVLGENTDYTVSKDTNQTDTTWSKYTYKIKPDNFKNDGVYTLRISSTDKASITSQTVDYDICSATFSVDSTPADIISVNYSTEVNKIAGKDEGSAKTDVLTVNFTVEDIIRLERVEVYVNDMETPVETYEFGVDFTDANTFDGGSFNLSGSSQSFNIIAIDKAGNKISTADGYYDKDGNHYDFEPGFVFFDHITVTTNQLVIWAKSPVFWAIIGGFVLVTVGIVAVVVVKKRKNNNEKSL